TGRFFSSIRKGSSARNGLSRTGRRRSCIARPCYGIFERSSKSADDDADSRSADERGVIVSRSFLGTAARGGAARRVPLRHGGRRVGGGGVPPQDPRSSRLSVRHDTS